MSEGKLENHVTAAAAALPVPVRTALKRIDGAPRQLLALRSYVKAGKSVTNRWSWSDERIAKFAKSAEYRKLVASVDQARRKFEEQNPGYSLLANTQTRSLDRQILRWNENKSVARVADALHQAATAELEQGEYPIAATSESAQRFARFLRNWWPKNPAPLAAPGLSLHGQARAIDVLIVKDGRVVAGASVGNVREAWERHGWDRKLRDAMDAATFIGPLKAPNEPWHYEYVRSADRLALSEPETVKQGG